MKSEPRTLNPRNSAVSSFQFRVSGLSLALLCASVFSVVVLSASADLVYTEQATNITSTAADAQFSVGQTNGFDLSIWYGTFDGGTSTSLWQYVVSTESESSVTGVVGQLALTNITAGQLYYYRPRITVYGGTNGWGAHSTNFWSLSGVATSTPTGTAYPVMVDTNGVLISPTNLLTTNGIASTGSVGTLAASYLTSSGLAVSVAAQYLTTSGKVDSVNASYLTTSGTVGTVAAQYLTTSGKVDSVNASYLTTSGTVGTVAASYLNTSGKVDTINSSYLTSSGLAVSVAGQYAVTSGKVDSAIAGVVAASGRVDTLYARLPGAGFLAITNAHVYAMTNTYQLVTNWLTITTNLTVASTTNLTLKEAGYWEIGFQISFDGAATTPHYEFEVWTNGAACDAISFERDTPYTASGSGSAMGILYLPADTVVDLRGKADGEVAATILKAQFKAELIR